MVGDFSRLKFDLRKRYSGVLLQQGRVQLDSDWNEEVAIVSRWIRTVALDAFGPVGLPLTTPDAFRIGLIHEAPNDLSIGAGRLYVDGLLAEHFPGENYSYLKQPFLPAPPQLPKQGDVIVYLDVWERDVTFLEDPSLLEKAIGTDTTIRRQTVWQVKIDAREGAQCGTDVGELPSAGCLSIEVGAPQASDDPSLMSPLGGYRGTENRLYRVEIHDGGPLGKARFKWSRDNGSIISALTNIQVLDGRTTLTLACFGSDPVQHFRCGDWVSVTDDYLELAGEPPEMAQIAAIDEMNHRIVLDRGLPRAGERALGTTPDEIVDHHSRIQRWDQTASSNAIDGDGLIATTSSSADVEDGIKIQFTMDPRGGAFHAGDYWVFAARVSDASVELLSRAPPRGIHHHYAPLATIRGLGNADPQVSDCRPRHGHLQRS